MKRVFCVLATFLVCLFLSANAALAEGTEYSVEGQRYSVELEGEQIEGQAFVAEGNLYLPLREVCTPLGYKVTWSGSERKILLTSDMNIIELGPENFQAKVNEHESYLPEIFKLADGKTYLRETFLEDYLGLDVSHSDAMVKITPIKVNPISVKTIRETSETDEIKITLLYPQLEGVADKTVQDNLNGAFKKVAEDARNEGLKNASELEEAKESAKEAGYETTPNKCETFFDYLVKYNQNGLLSIVFLDYQYSGGAHGLTVQSSTTRNLSTGQEYQLKDFFVQRTDHVSIVSQEVKNLMEEQGLTEALLNPFSAISADQNYYLTNDDLVVYFQAYEYFPYAAGIPEFSIKYSRLKGNFKPGFEFLE